MPSDGRPSRLPLTQAQRGLWFAQQVEPDSPAYLVAEYLEVRGQLNLDRLFAAYQQAVLEIDALHLRFDDADGEPFQWIERPEEWSPTLLDLSHEVDPAAAAHAWMQADLAQPRDVRGADLFAEVVIKLGPQLHFIYQRVHHLLLDGYGAMLALQRITDIHDALSRGETPGASPFGPLTSLLDDEATYRASETYATDRAFWEQHTAGSNDPPRLGQAPHGPTPHQLTRRTARFPQEHAAELIATARTERTSLPAAVLTATALYLHRHTGQRDIILGLPVAARRSEPARTVPAMVSNIVPLHLHVRPNEPVRGLLRRTAQQTRQVLRHQRFHYEELRRGNPGSVAGPQVNIMPSMHEIVFAGLPATVHNLAVGPVADLSIVVHGLHADEDLLVDFQANPQLYTPDEVDEHQRRLLGVLQRIAAAPDSPVGAIALLDEAEQDAAVEFGRGPVRELPPHTVLAEFDRSAAQHVHSWAVTAPDGSLTFAELDAQANQWARYLIELGAAPGAIVGVRMGRSTNLAVAMLAVLKSGAACLPLDPDYPQERLDLMVEDARPLHILGHGDAATLDMRRPEHRNHTGGLSSAPVGEVEHPRPLDPDDLAYVIYTSGSTGRPKGVAVEHRSLLNLLQSHRERIFNPASEQAGRRLRVAHTAGLSFDAAWDPFLWLVDGHPLHLVDDELRRDPQRLVDQLAHDQIDVVETTPSFARALIGEGFLEHATPRVLLLGGEAVEEDMWAALATRADLTVHNLYGPTEAAVDALTIRFDETPQPELGHVVPNAAAYVLDPGLRPASAGATGELYLSGAGIARGYVRRPIRTAESFVADPFAADGSRMYRTGDLVQRRTDGGLRFLGRSDHQVKIRGVRVEPGEVAAVLREHPEVSDAAVVPVGQGTEARLAAYVAAEAHVVPADVRDRVAERLPAFMVPSTLDVLARLPLTPSGKLDHAALPAPTAAAQPHSRPPRTSDERILCQVFAEVLGIEQPGIDDDFFALGGHSLLAARAVARIRDELDTSLAIRELFENPTVAGLAAALPTHGTGLPPLEPRSRPDRIPLSPGQRGLWFLNRLDPDSRAYNIPAAVRLTGKLDETVLYGAVREVLERHETLRTIFPADDDGPRQRILAARDVRLDFAAISCSEAEAGRVLQTEAGRGFDLTTEVPLRVRLLHLGGDQHLLLLVVHHIAGDGWSLAPLARDLAASYTSRVQDAPLSWTPLPVQYADYALWQHDVLGDETDPHSELSRQLNHWKHTLSGAPDELDLPTDRPRPARPSGSGGSVPVHLSADLHTRLAEFGRARGASLFMVLHAGLAGLLTRLGAGEDVPVGAPVAGRHTAELRDLVGYFVNTLVLRTDTSSDPSFGELVDRVRETDLAAYAHQDLPFDRIVEEVRPPRSPARHPLFQVMLAMQAQAPSQLDMPGLQAHLEPGPQSTAAKFDLSLNLVEQGETAPAGLTGELEYSRDLFDEKSVATMVSRLVQLLETMADDPAARLGDADILLPGERQQLHSGTDGPHRPVRERTVLDAFAHQAAARPDRTAVATAETQLTFAELDAHSQHAASGLTTRGIGPGSTVAVLLDRTVELPVALLGVLRSGAACLPLDHAQPPERIAHMLQDARPECVITEPGTELASTHVTYHLSELRAVAAADAGTTPQPPEPDDAAYVIYTSGSTGRPKGIVVEHRGLANLLEAHRAEMIGRTVADLGEPLRVAHTAGMSFDAAWDPFLWMVDGHELHIVADAVRTDAQQLLDYLAKQHIDVIETTPSYVRELVALGLVDNEPRPRLVALGGEPVDAALWQQLAATPGVSAYNLYGPAEATVDTVSASSEDEPTPAIGTPLANVSARVLDSRLRPVPAGVVGELYLTGACLARGYLNRVDLTAARFVADPHGTGERMYRTGDLAVRRPNGALHHMGRSDDQVKIRGHRIEPGEIETVLSEFPAVAQAAALVETTHLGDARILAYVTTHSESLDTTELRAYAANRLPAALVPSAITVLTRIPRTPNGKLDRSALPAPDTEAGRGREPRTRDERYLCEIFAEVLDVPEVSLDDDFFELGGHSLLAVRLTARIRTVLGVHVAIRTVFEKPSPARLVAELDAPHRSRPPLRARPRPQRPPLSYGQRRLWFLNRMDPTAADYNIPMAVRIRGPLHLPSLRGALADVVARHESLRTVFPEHDGVPYQQVLRPEAPDCPLLVPETGSDSAVRDLLATHAQEGFDLQHETPLRARIVRVTDTEHVLLLVLHHIAGDGWSITPLARDLSTAYAARVREAAPLSHELAVQYVDFALWQREVLGDPDDPESPAARSLHAWQERLAGAPEELNLPYDRRRGAADRHVSGTVPVQIGPQLQQRVNTLARATSASPFMVLQAALAALYQRIGAGEDIVLGTPVAGRTDPALDDMVGFFVNTLALRTDTSGNPTFTDLLARVRDADLDAFDDQEVPFEQIVERIQPTRSPNRHPIFQTMLALQNNQSPTLELPGLSVVPEEPIDTGTAKFDLSFSLTEQECPAGGAAGIEGTLEYDGALFDAATAHSLVDRYVRLLDSASRMPDTPLGRLRLLAEDEHAALTTGQAPAPTAQPHTIVELFVAQARRTPDAVAVVSGTEQLTFTELESRSRGVAHTLTRYGAGPGTTVAVGVPRGLAMIVYLLGVLRSGAAYLPLDLDHPTERIVAILDDAAPTLVVGGPALGEHLGEYPLVLPDELDAEPAQSQQPTGPSPAHAAYVIYTSGSTGRPKGVEVEHGSLANLFHQHRAELFAPATAEQGSRLRVAHTAGVAFDAAWDPILWLVDGHELHLVCDDVRRNPAALVDYLRGRAIDSVEITPSHARQLLTEGAFDGPQAPTVVALGGEAIDPDLWRELGNRTQLRTYNFYGPTECTVDASIATIEADTEPRLGEAVAGAGMYVLDSGMQPVPRGAEGELYISGAGLARGYLHRPALTGERFVADPFAPAGVRMYRTGDRVRRLSDGSLQFQGRTDDQVTLRGYRIEPGEIQAGLVEHDDIAEAAVAVQYGDSAGERLVGYLVERGHTPLSDHELREHLRQRVPVYMVPGVFVRMAELPLTVNGKLDRSALPDPTTHGAASVGAVAGNEASGPREAVLCAVFADVLDLPAVGPHDGFFDLGGHSLLAAQLVTRASAALGTSVTVPMLFQAPTPARLLARADEGSASTGLEPVLALRTSGAEEPLFCIHPAGGLAWGYSGLLRHLQSSRPLYGIQAPGIAPDTDPGPAPSDVTELADTYVRAIRAVQPEGPYHLLGWSFGGNIAHAVALRLGQLGHSVATLALMDAFPTGQDSNDPFTDDGELFGALVQALGYAEEGKAPEDLDAAGVLDLLQRHGDPMGSLDEQTVHAMVHSFGQQAALLRAHQPGVFDGDLLHFTATRGKAPGAPTVDDWQAHVTGSIIRHDIDVTHARMVRDQALAEIGPRLDAHMRRAVTHALTTER